MKKIKLLSYLIIVFGLFFLVGGKFVIARVFEFRFVCQPPLTAFSNKYHTFNVFFPPGGGTTCDSTDAVMSCPKISLPVNSIIYSIKVDMVPTYSEIGTPYIWIPITEDPGKIKQINTNNCSVIETYDVVSNPSRTYVVPGGDVWVGSLTGTEVSKLSPLTGNIPNGNNCGDGKCGTEETLYSCPPDCSGNSCGDSGDKNCRKYKVAGSFSPVALKNGITGITGDINRDLWIANHDNNSISKFDATSWPPSEIISNSTGDHPFGAIGDFLGHIWISNYDGNKLQCADISDISSGVVKDVAAIHSPYGIGIDKENNVFVASHDDGIILKFDAVSGNCPSGVLTPSETYDTRVLLGPEGVAVDQKGYVWTANPHDDELYVFVGSASDDWYDVHLSGADPNGVAIDSNGYGWVVSHDGVVYKYAFNDEYNMFDLQCQTKNLGGKSESYSDMTGLRLAPKTISAGGISDIALSPARTFELCADGDSATTCDGATTCTAITNLLLSPPCVPDTMNNCEIPLEIFSAQGGNYTLKNLEVVYKKQVPVTTGGLIPCGREWDDNTTSWDDTMPCNFCFFILMINNIMNFLMMLASGVAVLFLIIAGLLFVISSGDTERKNQAKTAAKYVIIGFVVIFISWIIVDFLLTGWGYLDPLGGEWNVICD